MAIIELEVEEKKRRGNPNNRIKYYREKYNFSQEDLSKKLGVSAKTISFWKNGERDIGYTYIIQMMEIFDTSFEDLMCLEKDYNKMKEVNTSGLPSKAVLRLNLFLDDIRTFNG